MTSLNGKVGSSLTLPCPVDAFPQSTNLLWYRIVNASADVLNITSDSRYSGGTVQDQVRVTLLLLLILLLLFGSNCNLNNEPGLVRKGGFIQEGSGENDCREISSKMAYEELGVSDPRERERERELVKR
jgi:hypothetical protein